eukprot:2342037-Pleurochrysis_carterae.AAC.1
MPRLRGAPGRQRSNARQVQHSTQHRGTAPPRRGMTGCRRFRLTSDVAGIEETHKRVASS